MRHLSRFTVSVLVLFLLVVSSSSSGSQKRQKNPPSADAQDPSDVVYVCACLKTKSCACMTEAKTEGPCACGTEGGPPLTAVPRDSAWARANREALAGK